MDTRQVQTLVNGKYWKSSDVPIDRDFVEIAVHNLHPVLDDRDSVPSVDCRYMRIRSEPMTLQKNLLTGGNIFSADIISEDVEIIDGVLYLREGVTV